MWCSRLRLLRDPLPHCNWIQTSIIIEVTSHIYERHDLIFVYHNYFLIIIHFSLSMLQTKDAWCFRVSVSCKFIFTIEWMKHVSLLMTLYLSKWHIIFASCYYNRNMSLKTCVLCECARKMSCIELRAREHVVNLSYDLAPDYNRLC